MIPYWDREKYALGYWWFLGGRLKINRIIRLAINSRSGVNRHQRGSLAEINIVVFKF